jgi:hypothetical protein
MKRTQRMVRFQRLYKVTCIIEMYKDFIAKETDCMYRWTLKVKLARWEDELASMKRTLGIKKRRVC